MYTSTILLGAALPLFALAVPVTPNARLPASIFPRQDDANCDLSNMAQPSSTLTQPTSDMSLVLIALGHGTQNYTCSDASSAPAAIGALAQLFNASCAVANNDASSLASVPEDSPSIGMHFFLDSTTPDFDIAGLGNTVLKKAEAVNAPDASNDVAWLKLDAQTDGTTSTIRNIYRLETKGGVAPTTCEGKQPGELVTVEYEAQYWIYACKTDLVKRGAGITIY